MEKYIKIWSTKNHSDHLVALDAAEKVLLNPTKEKHRIFEYENGISVIVQMESKGVSVRVMKQ